MTRNRLRFLLVLITAAWCAGAAAQDPSTGPSTELRTGSGQAYPSRPIRLVVPYAAGGLPDTMARIASPRLVETFGQQFVVDNRPGAGGISGCELVARATPDGYTLLIADVGQTAINPAVYSKLPSIAPHIKAGRLKLLGVNTIKRSASIRWATRPRSMLHRSGSTLRNTRRRSRPPGSRWTNPYPIPPPWQGGRGRGFEG